MRIRYPMFLSQNPSFMGLGFTDLIIVGVGLMVSLSFEMDSIKGTCATITAIVFNKWISRNLDIKGFVLGFHSKTLDWMDSISQRRL